MQVCVLADLRVRGATRSTGCERPTALGVRLEQRLSLLETLGVGRASLDVGAGLGGRHGVGAAKDGKDAEEQREEQGGEHREGRGGTRDLVSGGGVRCEVGWWGGGVGYGSVGALTSDWVS